MLVLFALKVSHLEPVTSDPSSNMHHSSPLHKWLFVWQGHANINIIYDFSKTHNF